MRVSTRKVWHLLAFVMVAGFALVPMGANADPSYYETPLFGLTTTADGRLLVADAGQGIVDADNGSLLASLPGVTDMAPMEGGGLWALTGIFPGSALYKVDGSGNVVAFADILGFEEKRNPHPAEIDSNAFDVADLGGGEALVADAGGNDLLLVNKHGKVKLVAVLPDELVSTENAKNIAGCPNPPPIPEIEEICELPPMIPAEPVATSVAIGPDGAYYVGELKGFPAPLGESRVWRIDPHARNAKCGVSPLCTVVFDGFTSVIDLVVGPDGKLYVTQIDDASWLAVEAAAFGIEATVGGSVHACDLETMACDEIISGVPILTSIAFRADGSMWGSTWSLVPGMGDVIQLMP